MSTRTAACAAFLDRHGQSAAVRTPVSGDASNRRYERLALDGRTTILMDAPPEKGEDVRPFIRIATHLRACGLSAPEILAADEAQGFLLLEDLGDDLYARILETLSGSALAEAEMRLYAPAIDALADLHAAPLPAGIAAYDAPLMSDLAALPFDWYLQGLGQPDAAGRATFHAAIRARLAELDRQPQVLILRDYHAENLIWLPGRDGAARVGQLDFQDAMAGHPAYDMVSLLQDARRDVSPDLAQVMIARYCAATVTDPEAFAAAYHLLGLQRNMRILGVFSRLCIRDGKPRYLGFIPRVWDHIQRDLAHPTLADLAPLVTGALPPPTPDRLARLKEQCASPLTA
ncbi:aminoglycoside phosphotransferase family protein [Pseudooceanicola sp. LIPI14-2-Ac024]|uniref:aminoglycoside phosphotransferase family protein n=1 Tax=Pseudooceanicola sp. LIPI14-2-Ac024 TaxID=3344875 RepID=UPI0035D0E699